MSTGIAGLDGLSREECIELISELHQEVATLRAEVERLRSSAALGDALKEAIRFSDEIERGEVYPRSTLLLSHDGSGSVTSASGQGTSTKS